MAAEQLTVLLMTEPNVPSSEKSEEVRRFAVPAVNQWAVVYGFKQYNNGGLCDVCATAGI